MAQYQKVEFRIGKDGKITESVINASGSSCTLGTADMEAALGSVEKRELLPEYYAEPEMETTSENWIPQTQQR